MFAFPGMIFSIGCKIIKFEKLLSYKIISCKITSDFVVEFMKRK